MTAPPLKAFVLAAGLGTRMRPLTDTLPKPLVPLAGRALIDHVLDRIAATGIAEAVVNVHYMADLIEAHLAHRKMPTIRISNERGLRLETGGGLVKAWALLGGQPVLVHNSDTVWIEHGLANLDRLINGFDPERMDGLLLLARKTHSLGYDGRGDFHIESDGRLRRVGPAETSDLVFAGASIAGPRLVEQAPDGAFSINRLWDRAIDAGRLFGLVLDGTWMHVGDPAAVAAAEARLAAEGARHDGGRS